MIAKGFQARLCLLPTKPLEEFMLELPAPDITSLYPAALHDAALSRLRRGVVYVGPGKTAVLLARWVGRSVGSAATAGSLPDICSVLGEGKGTPKGDGSANKSFSLKDRIVKGRQAEKERSAAGGAAADAASLPSDGCFALLQIDGKAMRYSHEPAAASASADKRRSSLLGRKRKEEPAKGANKTPELVPAPKIEEAIFAFAGGVRLPLGAIDVADREDGRKDASSSYTLHLWHTSALGKAPQPELQEHAPDVIFHFDVVNEPFTPRTQLSNISERPSAECMATGMMQPSASTMLPHDAPGVLRPAPRLLTKRSRGLITATATPLQAQQAHPTDAEAAGAQADAAASTPADIDGPDREPPAVSAEAAYDEGSAAESLSRPRSANTFAGGSAPQSCDRSSRVPKSATGEGTGSHERLSFAAQSRRLSLVEVLAADPPAGWDAAEQARREQQRADFFAVAKKAPKPASLLQGPDAPSDAANGVGCYAEGDAGSPGVTGNGAGLHDSGAAIAATESLAAAHESSRGQRPSSADSPVAPAAPCAPQPRPRASAPAHGGSSEHADAADEDSRAARRHDSGATASACSVGTVTEAELWHSRRDVAALKKQAATLEQQRQALEERWRARQMDTVQRERREYERKIAQREQEILRLQELLAVAPDAASIDQNGDARSELHVLTNGASH